MIQFGCPDSSLRRPRSSEHASLQMITILSPAGTDPVTVRTVPLVGGC